MKAFKYSLTIVLLVFLSEKSKAALSFSDAIFPELIVSGRALAMGNAFIGRVDDSSAVFYNPAGLGTVRHPHVHLSNFHFEVNRGWMDVSTGGGLTDIITGLPNGFKLDGLRKNLLNNKGKIVHSRFHMAPNLTSRYFSAGFLLSQRTKATIGTAAGDQFEYADRLDYGPYAAVNLSIAGGVVKIGVAGFFLRREEAIGSSDTDLELKLESGDFNKGVALIINSGAKLTLPIVWLPTIAINMHNLTQATFSASGAGAPTEVPSAIDAGFAITPNIGKNSRLHIEANYKDLFSATSDVSVLRKILLGVELDFFRTFYFRLGYGDGFGSAGFGIKSRKLEFDFTTYAVDTTSDSFRGREDRRFAMTISSGF